MTICKIYNPRNCYLTSSSPSFFLLIFLVDSTCCLLSLETYYSCDLFIHLRPSLSLFFYQFPNHSDQVFVHLTRGRINADHQDELILESQVKVLCNYTLLVSFAFLSSHLSIA